MTSFKMTVCLKVWNNFFKILLFCIPIQLIHFDCVNGFLNSIKEIIWQTGAIYCCPLNVQSHSMLNLTYLTVCTPPSIFLFFVWYGSWYWWNVKILKMSTFCFVLFFFFVGYSDLNFRCFSTKNAMWYVATWKTTLRGAKFCDKPPCNV